MPAKKLHPSPPRKPRVGARRRVSRRNPRFARKKPAPSPSPAPLTIPNGPKPHSPNTVVMAGRLIPGYTRAMLIPLRQPKDPGREKASIVLAMLLLMADLSGWREGIGLAAIALAALQAWRLSGWRTIAVFRHPILLVLHIGFGWLALGLALRGVAALTDWLSDTDALHAITIGAIGMLTLGMAGRLLRMHGRRPLTASSFEVWGYASLFLAAAFRALIPVVLPELSQIYIPASAFFWILAFALFLLEHALGLGRPPKSSPPP